MPSTNQIVEWIHVRNPKYSPTQILEFLNEIHRMCVSQEIDEFLYIDPATGMPPHLVTQKGVFTYNCPANCRKTSKLFIESRNHGLVRSYYLVRPIENARYKEFQWCGKWFYEVPYISQRDAIPDAGVLATVTFGGEEDPGDHSKKFHHLYWILPNEIESLDDELQLPPQTHFYIMKAVSSYMATEDYGETAQDQAVIEQCTRKVRNIMSKGANGRVGRTLWRPEYRDF